MSYMRGDNYIWQDGDEMLHFWTSQTDEGGSMLPMDVFDDLVVMRYAELLAQGRVEEVNQRSRERYAGNVGCQALERLLAPGAPTAFERTVSQARSVTESSDKETTDSSST